MQAFLSSLVTVTVTISVLYFAVGFGLMVRAKMGSGKARVDWDLQFAAAVVELREAVTLEENTIDVVSNVCSSGDSDGSSDHLAVGGCPLAIPTSRKQMVSIALQLGYASAQKATKAKLVNYLFKNGYVVV